MILQKLEINSPERRNQIWKYRPVARRKVTEEESILTGERLREMGKHLRNARQRVVPEGSSRAISVEVAAEAITNAGYAIKSERLYKVEQGKSPIARELVEAAQEAYNVANNELTSVYLILIDREDSGAGPTLKEAARTAVAGELITATVLRGGGSAPWTAKDFTKLKKRAMPMVAAECQLIELDEQVGNLRQGLTLAFKPQAAVPSNVWLLLTMRRDSETFCIRYSRDKKTFEGGPDINPDEWRVKGYLVAALEGLGDDLDSGYINYRGIGPDIVIP